MTQTSLSPRAWAELLLLGLIWGGSFLAIRFALDAIGPLTAVLYRTGLAAMLLWPLVLWRREALPGAARLWGSLFVMGCLNNALPFTLMTWGQLHIPSGLASILNANTAILGVLVAAMVFADERLTLRKGLGVALGFAGVVTAIGPAALMSLDITSTAQLAVVAGTLSYACAGAWARKRLGGLSPVMAATGMLTCSTLVMLPITLIFEGIPDVALPLPSLAGVLYYAVVATALAYMLFYRVLAMAGSGNTMLVTLLIPPTAIFLGAWVRDETLAPTAYAGLGLLALGLVILDGRVARLLGFDAGANRA